MKVLDTTSLGRTLDAVNEALFFGRDLSDAERNRVAAWIAGRQGKPGAYAGMFAPTARDFKQGVQLFTGETVWTRAGTAHVLGEEACRALVLLDVKSTRDALGRATEGMLERLRPSWRRSPGVYCCGTCSVAIWRHLAAGGLDEGPRRLAAAMKALKAHREQNGRWRRFPFYYTLLALLEIGRPLALEEMRHAAPVLERYVRRPAEEDESVARRRRTLAERILAAS